jgi:catechol 2,3-dioxygenase-like lactoylglutathione lyase family enzyme
MEPFPADRMELTRLIVVRDVAVAREWYTRVLGATLHGEYGGTSLVLQIVGAWLLVVTGGGPTEDKPTVTFEPPADPDRVSAELIFRVPDCRAAYATLTARGATFLHEPVDNGFEVRAFLRDPDGHLFEISSLHGAPS